MNKSVIINFISPSLMTMRKFNFIFMSVIIVFIKKNDVASVSIPKLTNINVREYFLF